jgi:hypothetical protein
MQQSKLWKQTRGRRLATAAAVPGIAAALVLGALVSAPGQALAQAQGEVTVTVVHAGDYVADSVCVSDTTTGTCTSTVRKGQSNEFRVNPAQGSKIEVRVFASGGSDIELLAPNGPRLCVETGGAVNRPEIRAITCADGHEHGAPASSTAPGTDKPAAPKPARGKPVSLTAELTGAQEIPGTGGAVGDPDGRATAQVEIRGDRVTFALRWQGLSQLKVGHIHEGAAGVNGDVRVALFKTPMPTTVNAAAGQVSIEDAALAERLRTNPAGFYVNLHSTEFPGGAVRGQLAPAKKRINVTSILRGGKLHALADGDQEVEPADGKKFGDPDGFAVAFLQPRKSTVDYSMAWVNIGPPTKGHIHQERFGKNGPVKIDLFDVTVPQNIVAVSGTAAVDPALADEIRRDPHGFYANLHTEEFPGGAVRGQFFA